MALPITSTIIVDELGFCIDKNGPLIENLTKSEISNTCILASNYLKEVSTNQGKNSTQRDSLIIEQVFTVISSSSKRLVIKCKPDQGIAVVELHNSVNSTE